MARLWIPFALLALAACHPRDVCKRAAAAGPACGLPYAETTLASCEDALSRCSGDDRAALDGLFTCSQDATADSCVASATDLAACGVDPSDLSDGCAEVLTYLLVFYTTTSSTPDATNDSGSTTRF